MNFFLVFFIILSSLVGAVGNSILKMASNIDINGLSYFQINNNVVVKKIALFSASGFFYVLGFILWGMVLSKSSLSKSYPLYVSFTFIFITVISTVFLGETLSWKIGIGYFLILVGIYLIV